MSCALPIPCPAADGVSAKCGRRSGRRQSRYWQTSTDQQRIHRHRSGLWRSAPKPARDRRWTIPIKAEVSFPVPPLGLLVPRVGNRRQSAARAGTKGCGLTPHRAFDSQPTSRSGSSVWCPAPRICALATRFQRWPCQRSYRYYPDYPKRKLSREKATISPDLVWYFRFRDTDKLEEIFTIF